MGLLQEAGWRFAPVEPWPSPIRLGCEHSHPTLDPRSLGDSLDLYSPKRIWKCMGRGKWKEAGGPQVEPPAFPNFLISESFLPRQGDYPTPEREETCPGHTVVNK